jgi:predicted  nucleic acid-binding Zn-ribbon protein
LQPQPKRRPPMKNESSEIVSLKDEIQVLRIEIDNLKKKVQQIERELDNGKKRIRIAR